MELTLVIKGLRAALSDAMYETNYCFACKEHISDHKDDCVWALSARMFCKKCGELLDRGWCPSCHKPQP